MGKPTEDIVGNGLGVGDLMISGESRGLETRVAEFIDENLQGHPVLQGIGDSASEGVHETRHRGAFLGHVDEDLAGFSIRVQAYRDIALVAGDSELVR